MKKTRLFVITCALLATQIATANSLYVINSSNTRILIREHDFLGFRNDHYIAAHTHTWRINLFSDSIELKIKEQVDPNGGDTDPNYRYIIGCPYGVYSTDLSVKINAATQKGWPSHTTCHFS